MLAACKEDTLYVELSVRSELISILLLAFTNFRPVGQPLISPLSQQQFRSPFPGDFVCDVGLTLESPCSLPD